MARRGKRYEDEPKLNIKKIIGVIVFILIVIAFIFGMKYLLESHTNSLSGKIETVTYYTAYDEGKWGVINSQGNLVIDTSYDEIIVIPDNTKAVFICTYDVDMENGTYKTKAINAKGKEVIKGYDKIEAIANIDKNKKISYESDTLKIEKDGKYGLVDLSGKVLLPCEYDTIEPIQEIENSLIISKDGKFGLVDSKGNIVIDTKYSKIEKIGDSYKNGYVVANEEGKFGIIGYDKQTVLECKYDEVKAIPSTNLFAVKQDDKYVIIDKNGDTVVENDFDDVEEIGTEYIVTKKNDKCGIIDLQGGVKVEYDYQEIKSAGSFYIAKKDDKYGVIDIEGNEKIAFDAIEINYYSTGKVFVVDYLEDNEITSKVMDENFETKVEGTILEVNEEKGYFKVTSEDEYKYYNFKFEEKSSSSILTNNTIFVSQKDGKYGFVDKDGNVVVDYIYDDATEENTSGYAGIKKDGLWGTIDSKGNIIVEPQYNLDNNTKIDFINTWRLCEDANANYYLDT